MIARTAMIFASTCAVSFAAVRSGKATAEWLAASSTYEAEKPVRTGVRLVLDEKWHTYWSNPGEGGMEISVKWELPDGWKAGPLEHPAPKRFMTGDLPGFGYEGTVVFPVVFTPPPGFTGEAKLKGKISWLTCNDDSCIPGDAEVELSLQPGAPAATPEAKLIEAASEKIPQPADGLALLVVENSDKLTLTISGGVGDAAKISEFEVFPATLQTVDPGAVFKFVQDGDRWTSEVPKNEYASGPVKELTLVLSKKGSAHPLSVTWKAD